MLRILDASVAYALRWFSDGGESAVGWLPPHKEVLMFISWIDSDGRQYDLASHGNPHPITWCGCACVCHTTQRAGDPEWPGPCAGCCEPGMDCDCGRALANLHNS